MHIIALSRIIVLSSILVFNYCVVHVLNRLFVSVIKVTLD
jgi:hypothetical protein